MTSPSVASITLAAAAARGHDLQRREAPLQRLAPQRPKVRPVSRQHRDQFRLARRCQLDVRAVAVVALRAWRPRSGVRLGMGRIAARICSKTSPRSTPLGRRHR
jgi:hypothetical protein